MTTFSRRLRHGPGVAAVVIFCVAALVACGGNSAVDESGGEPARGVAPSEKTVDGEDRSANSSANSKSSSAVKLPQSITYEATVGVRVDDLTAQNSAAERLVERAGGHVENQNVGTAGGPSTATTTFRVPAEKYRSTLKQLGALGKRTSLTQQADNVTQEVADVDQRVKSAEASLTRLRGLLKDATDVTDLVAIESEITTRESDLEALKARQRSLDDQVSYATITLTLTSKQAPEKEETGFLAGLSAGWHGLVTFLGGAATVIGAVLPFLLVIAPVAAVCYLGWRRFSRAAARRTTESSS